MLDWKKFYAPGNQGNRFGIKGPFYGPDGHRGQDYYCGTHDEIPTFIRARCVLNGHSSVLGNYTVLKRGIWFYGWAHLLVGTRPDVGAVVALGESVGQAAGSADDHGSAWHGAHAHTTRSLTQLGIVYGKVFDPVAAIKKALAAVVAK